jgi:hypothetical protein
VIGSRQLTDRPPDGKDWYANLLWLSGRKCLLITHAATLFTVFEADVRAADLRDPGRLVTGLISRELLREQLPAAAIPVPAGRRAALPDLPGSARSSRSPGLSCGTRR